MTYALQSHGQELEAEARAFVRRSAAAYGFDPDKVWRDHHEKLLKRDLGWFVNQRKQEELLADDYQASRMPGRNSLPRIQWPGVVEAAPLQSRPIDHLQITLSGRQTQSEWFVAMQWQKKPIAGGCFHNLRSITCPARISGTWSKLRTVVAHIADRWP